MAEEKTAEQVKAERIEKLGPKLGPVFHALSDDVAWLQVKWAEYRELFGTSPGDGGTPLNNSIDIKRHRMMKKGLCQD